MVIPGYVINDGAFVFLEDVQRRLELRFTVTNVVRNISCIAFHSVL